MATTVASALQPVLDRLFRGAAPPIGFRFWDGTTLGPSDAKATVVLRSPMALRRILYAPGELGFGRAYVAGELDVERRICRHGWGARAALCVSCASFISPNTLLANKRRR